MTSRIYTIDEISQIVAPIARQHGVNKVYLFVSYAQGAATISSDVDLWVDAPSLRRLFALGGLYADFEEALDKKLDLVTVNAIQRESNKSFRKIFKF